MTLSHIARGTQITAEILDPKMDQYLRLAQVSEIIYPRECSRLLIANASGGTGVSNIIFDLLDPRTSTLLTARPIPEGFVHSRYAAFKADHERQNPGTVVIGILESTGNPHRLKEMAVRQAQKTSDTEKLVQNLRSVKGMRCNHPLFNPDGDYRIPEGAMAIVIESHAEQYLEMGHVPGLEAA